MSTAPRNPSPSKRRVAPQTVLPDSQDEDEPLAEPSQEDEEMEEAQEEEDDEEVTLSNLRVPSGKSGNAAAPANPTFAHDELNALWRSVGDTSDLPDNLDDLEKRRDAAQARAAEERRRFVELAKEKADLEQRMSDMRLLATAPPEVQRGDPKNWTLREKEHVQELEDLVARTPEDVKQRDRADWTITSKTYLDALEANVLAKAADLKKLRKECDAYHDELERVVGEARNRGWNPYEGRDKVLPDD